MRIRIVPALRIVSGVLGITLLFADPGNPFIWPLLFASAASIFPGNESEDDTRDVSKRAFVEAAVVAGIIVLLLAIPGSWWSSLDARVPSWAKQRILPFQARIAIALCWAGVMAVYLRRRARSAASQAPSNSA